MLSDVSVVIPTYNMADHLPDLWRSTVRSGLVHRALEILFVDDGSTNATDAVLRRCIGDEMPIAVRLEIRAWWIPRETWREFLWRTWDRGPRFGEYHLFERQGLYFWCVAGGGIAVLCVAAPPIGAAAVGGSLIAAASTAVFAKNACEFMRLAPLHMAVMGTFGAAAVRGIFVVGMQRLRRKALTRSPSPSPFGSAP